MAVESAPALPNGWVGGSRAVVFLSGPGVEALMSSVSELVSEVGFGSRLRSRLLLLFLYSITRPSHSGLSQTQDRPAATCGFERGLNKTDAIGRSHSRQPYEWVPAGAVPPLQVRFPARNTRIPLAARVRRRSGSPSAEQAIRRSRLLRAGSCKLVATCDNRGRAHLARRCVGQPLGPHKRRAHVRRKSGGTDSRDERRRVWCRHAVAA
jgi:hypothetical protein